MSDYRTSTIEFVQSAQAVLGAVDLYRTAVAAGEPGDIDFAGELLDNAANGYSGSTGKYQKMGFNELSLAAPGEVARSTQLTEDLLASALLDLEIGNTLIVAGRVGGETAEPLPLESLDEARSSLESLTRQVALPLGKSPGEPAAPARFGFAEAPAAAPLELSNDLSVAKAGYSLRLEDTLTSLRTQSSKVLSTSYKSLEGLDAGQISSALASVGETTSDIPHIGGLVSRGLELALGALDKITSLLGKDNSQMLKDKAKEVLEQVKSGGSLLDTFLNYTFGVESTRKVVAQQLQGTSADAARLNTGNKQLADLSVNFAERMELVVRITKALNLGKKMVDFALPKAVTELLFAAFYLLLMDYAVLTGMDYADTSSIYQFVNGVVKISEETLLP